MTPQLSLSRADGTQVRCCAECGGKGWVPCPATFAVRSTNDRGGMKQPSTGHPIPCPSCNGSKFDPPREAA